MEFAVITAARSLDLAKNFEPVKVGEVTVGLQAVKEDVAEIEIQGSQGVTTLKIPLGTAAASQGYTFINRDIGIVEPGKPKRRGFFGFGRKDDTPVDGRMEVELDVRWGDQALELAEPEKDVAHDFILVKQYEAVADRPLVYQNQDRLRFGEMILSIEEKVEEGSRNYKRERHAPLTVQFDGKDPEEWQIRMNDKYHRKGKYRVKITHHSWEDSWYQSYGVSIVFGRPKDESDETEREFAQGIADAAYSKENLGDSTSRLEEAKANPEEHVFSSGDSVNIGDLGLKAMSIAPGKVEIMVLQPRVKKTTLEHAETFEILKWNITLIGTYGEKAIIRVTED